MPAAIFYTKLLSAEEYILIEPFNEMKSKYYLVFFITLVITFSSNLKSFSQACSSPISGGVLFAPFPTVCPDVSSSVTVIVLGSSIDSGLTYQWQSAIDDINWSDVPDNNGITLNTSQSRNTYYRRKTMCELGGEAYSNSILISLLDFNKCYCTPSDVVSCSPGYTIRNVKLGTLDNNSECSKGYSDYTTTVAAPDIMQGTYQPLSVTVNSSVSRQYVHCYIDFNQNGQLEAKEYTRLTASSGIYNGFIKVPFNAKLGKTKMRIACNDIFNYTKTCDQSSFIETEDYAINITANASGKKGYVIYVKTLTTLSSNPGISWNNALPSLQRALEIATPGDTIKVAKGTYYTDNGFTNGFIAQDSIILLGGYPNTGSPTDIDRNFASNPTILSGYQSGASGQNFHVVYVSEAINNFVIDGFILENGGNYSGLTSEEKGGGISIENGANISIKNCVIRNNFTYSKGSAIAISNSSPIFYNCILEKNGGNSGNIAIEKNSNPVFYNLLAVHNSGEKVLEIDSSTVTFKNSTIAGNTFTSEVIRATNKSNLNIDNSILYFNSIYNSSNQSFSYDSVEISLNSSVASLNNCLTQVYDSGAELLYGRLPKFRDTSNVTGFDGSYFTADDGFSLVNPCSPAINQGSNSAAEEIKTDITGSPRIFETIVDIGAYEVQQNIRPIPAVVYVNAGANGLNNGSSWANAFRDLRQALEMCGDTIKVAAGTYSPDVTTSNQPYWIENKRVILGGYPSSGNPSDGERNYTLFPTIINGKTNNSVALNLVVRGQHLDSTSVLDGLTFANIGNNDLYQESGALIYSHSNNPVISNCTFSDNSRTIYSGIKNENPLLLNCTFFNNNSLERLVTVENSIKTTFRNCVFRDNVIPGSYEANFGIMVSLFQSNPIFDSCTFLRNHATVIFNYKSKAVFSNNRFLNNDGGDRTTDMINEQSAPISINCVFSDSAWRYYGANNGGILNNIESSPTFYNCQFNNGNAYYYGGLAYNDSSIAKFTNCIFSNCKNSFYNINNSNIILNNCINTGSNYNDLTGAPSFMLNVKSSPVLNNCVVVNNSSNDNGVILNDNSSFPQINNSIFWKNFKNSTVTDAFLKSRTDIKNENNSQLAVNNSMFEFFETGIADNNTKGVEPRFINYANPVGEDSIWFTSDDGLRLCNCSPAINTGSNSFATTETDISNKARIFGSLVDRGAYEFQDIPSSINLSKTYFVNASAIGTNTGNSWENAYTNLQSAVKNTCADTIKIAEGVYKSSVVDRDSVFDVTRNITFLGSYDTYNPIDSNRNPDIHPTIISGDIGNINDSTDNSFGLMKASYIDSLIVDGIVFRDANKNVDIASKNEVSFNTSYVQKLKIFNCRFYKNLNNNNGGALYLATIKDFDIRNTVFNQNKAKKGSGIYAYNNGATKKVTNCVFQQNESSDVGGGFWGAENDIIFNNCLFNKNLAENGGAGMYLENNPDITVINCTFSNNKLTGSYSGAGIYSSRFSWQGAGKGPIISNCIFTGNTLINTNVQYPYHDIYLSNNSTQNNGIVDLRIDHSAVSTNPYNYSFTGIINPNGIKYKNDDNAVGTDGKWFTADDGLQLTLCSTGIDQGLNSTITFIEDLGSRNRIFNSTVDMGAYEFSGTPEWTQVLNIANDSLIANKEITDPEGWTHYYKDCYYLMSLKKRGENIGSIGDGTFSVKVKTTPLYGTGSGTDLSSALYVTSGVSWKVMNRYWQVTPTNQPNDSIQVKFPYTNKDFIDIQGSGSNIISHQQMVFYKVDSQHNPMDLSVPLSSFHQYFHSVAPSTQTWTYSATDTIFQANYFIKSFSGGGGGGGTGTRGGALPVTIVSLTANISGNNLIQLNWQVENQMNIWKYVIERSTDGRVFLPIGEVAAINSRFYLYNDRNVQTRVKYYYRLKAVSYDNQATYTYIITAEIKDDIQTSLSIFPSPAKSYFTINVKGANLNEIVSVSIVSADGRICWQKRNVFVAGTLIEVKNLSLQAGIYTVIINCRHQVLSQKVMLTH